MLTREKEISHFRRTTAIQAALMTLEQDIKGHGGIIPPDEIIRRLRRQPGCGGLPDHYLLEAISLWRETRWAVEMNMLFRQGSGTRH